jgi:hypothetical protein
MTTHEQKIKKICKIVDKWKSNPGDEYGDEDFVTK